MDNNLLSSNLATGLTSLASSNPLGASPDATSGNSGTAVNTVKGADFANLFAQIMVDSTGQNLAGGLANGAASLANSAAPGTPSAGMPYLPTGLTTIPLGPQLQLVTAAKPLPDGSSLLAFARSQGLDESTVSHLFAEMSQKISTASVLGSSTPMSQSAPGADLQGSALFANLNALQSGVSGNSALMSSASAALPTQIQTNSGLVSISNGMTQAMQALQTEMTWQMGHDAGANPAITNPANPTATIPASNVGSSALDNSPVSDPVDLNANSPALSVAKIFLDSAKFPASPAAPVLTVGRSLGTLPLAQGKSTLSESSIDLKPNSPTLQLANDLQANFSALPPVPLNAAPIAPLKGSLQDLAKPDVLPNPVVPSPNTNPAAQVTPSLNLTPITLGNLSTLLTVPQSPVTSRLTVIPDATSNGLQPLKSDSSVVNSINQQLTNPLESRSSSTSMSSISNTSLDDAKGNDTGFMNALRLQLRPVEAVTQRLAAMVSQNESASWGNLTGFTQGEGAVLDLSLAAPSQADPLLGKGSNASHIGDFNDTLSALASLGNTTSESGAAVSGLASTQSVNSNVATDAAKPSFTDQLATSQQNYQQMSEKLGQALASRLQDQIQSGQWKMQMNVVPAHLGKISIDLNMHSGGLDATFKSDNAATRDLIVAGMPTLRHNLNQSGTTVASVWVNADARGQSGGNPTPGQGRQTPPEAKKNPLNPEDESDVSTGASDEAGWSLMA